MANPKEYQEVRPSGRKTWRAWLKKNHQSKKESIWLVLAKKASGLPSLTMVEAVEEALCFGWIDSRGGKVSDTHFKVLFAPRSPRSNWSKINKDRVKKLIDAGLMTDAGLKVINDAKKSGRWNALDEVEKLTLPPDLKKAFAKNKIAFKNFSAFPRSIVKMLLDWVQSAKREETRAKRIAEIVSKASENIRANQWRPKAASQLQ